MSLLDLRGVTRHFSMRRGLLDIALRRPPLLLRAVRGVDLTLKEGEILGVVGESGCGKSTLARLAVGLHACSSGEVLFEGKPLRGPHPTGRIQMVFQDPYSSLNPRHTIGAQLDEVLRRHQPQLSAAARAVRLQEILREVGLVPETAAKFPHALSGGQRQRVSIARALCPDPKILIADEPVSALDASVQAQIINLLKRLNREKGLTIIFISHDMNVVRYLCDRVAVMYLGEVVELAQTERLFSAPAHPYARALIAAVPDVRRPQALAAPITGEIPDPFTELPGCRFAPRCPLAEAACAQPQTLRPQPDGGFLRCRLGDHR